MSDKIDKSKKDYDIPSNWLTKEEFEEIYKIKIDCSTTKNPYPPSSPINIPKKNVKLKFYIE